MYYSSKLLKDLSTHEIRLMSIEYSEVQTNPVKASEIHVKYGSLETEVFQKISLDITHILLL